MTHLKLYQTGRFGGNSGDARNVEMISDSFSRGASGVTYAASEIDSNSVYSLWSDPKQQILTLI